MLHIVDAGGELTGWENIANWRKHVRTRPSCCTWRLLRLTRAHLWRFGMWETGGMKSIDVLDAQALILVRAGDQLRLSAGQEMRWNLSINRD